MNDDDFWGRTNPGDVSIDTANSKEVMTGSHITEQLTHEYQGPIPPELLNVTLNTPQTYVGIQTTTLSIYHVHPTCKKRAVSFLNLTSQ